MKRLVSWIKEKREAGARRSLERRYRRALRRADKAQEVVNTIRRGLEARGLSRTERRAFWRRFVAIQSKK